MAIEPPQTPPPAGDSAEKRGPKQVFEDVIGGPITRRSFCKAGALAGTFGACGAVGVAPFLKFKGPVSLGAILQQHYRRLSPEDIAKILLRLEGEIEKRHGVEVNIEDPKPLEGVEFAYALNIGRCVGCRRCVHACVKENNTSRDPEIQYIRVLEMPKATLDVEQSDHGYDPETVPGEDVYYMPVQCQQCSNPPCVKACPVGATWKEDDGIIVVDYNWCIGCRYCEAACPYWARRFNFAEPTIPPDEINTDMAYLGNRIRPVGTIEKCTFCLNRVRRGRYPACLEACPTGARQFGNMLDAESTVRRILKNKRVYILKQDAGTVPRFYYWFDK